MVRSPGKSCTLKCRGKAHEHAGGAIRHEHARRSPATVCSPACISRLAAARLLVVGVCIRVGVPDHAVGHCSAKNGEAVWCMIQTMWICHGVLNVEPNLVHHISHDQQPSPSCLHTSLVVGPSPPTTGGEGAFAPPHPPHPLKMRKCV